MWYTVCRENGNVIDCFDTLEEAVDHIKLYEANDKYDKSYTEDFYDVVNPAYGIYANGDWQNAYEKAILCSDYCTPEEAEKHLKNGTRIYSDSPFGFAEFVEYYEDDGTAECYDEIRVAWESLSRTELDGRSFRINYVL